MAGKMCPYCGRATFFETQTGRKCTNCGKFTVFNNTCRNYGAKYKQG